MKGRRIPITEAEAVSLLGRTDGSKGKAVTFAFGAAGLWFVDCPENQWVVDELNQEVAARSESGIVGSSHLSE